MRAVVLLVTALCFTTLAPALPADEGMWLFNDLPRELLMQRHGFAPDAKWTDHLMRSSVRFNSGGSGSFVSSQGLVLTNHHVGADTLHKLSTAERNLMQDGFLARNTDEELKAPDLELSQLLTIRDVTAEVQAAVSADSTAAEAATARRAVISRLEKSVTETGRLRGQVVTLYGGARYHLYQYKLYSDVRLVWAPETAIAFFGGDADNFEYPRYCLDACIFRVWEDNRPAETTDFLRWSESGPQQNDVVFVSGNPARTSRIRTVAALQYQRDHALPATLNRLRRYEILLQQYSLRGTEQARQARDDLFSIQNSRKARLGMLAGLQDPRIMKIKASAEAELLDAVRSNEQLQALESAWQQVAQTSAERAEHSSGLPSVRSTLLQKAIQIVQLVDENQKTDEARLPEFSDASRASLEQQLFSDAPVYPDLEQVLLAEWFSEVLESLGADDELSRKLIDGVSAADRAAAAIAKTKLADPEMRRRLVSGGPAAVQESADPLLRIARLIDPVLRAARDEADALAEQDRQAYASIAEAGFAVRGTSVYPDATFTLRLSFGPVSGYLQNGQQIPAWTTIGEAWQHQKQHSGQTDYQLPDSWMQARERLDLSTPFNFVCTADIIGGNSGSPVVNRNGELVGLIFDGNIQSLPGNYIYSDRQARAVSVHSSAIQEALKNVYLAEKLVAELGH